MIFINIIGYRDSPWGVQVMYVKSAWWGERSLSSYFVFFSMTLDPGISPRKELFFKTLMVLEDGTTMIYRFVIMSLAIVLRNDISSDTILILH